MGNVYCISLQLFSIFFWDLLWSHWLGHDSRDFPLAPKIWLRYLGILTTTLLIFFSISRYKSITLSLPKGLRAIECP
ncbi:hypothetical protein VIGAN_01353500 [Vigna angularis var. angularis]|uniref:Uncharacterized protein n=1 Tax=Vigna angularis var. angularis TaxID=157739 RepID=A0A0S3R4Y2_PHAAN|nr:hypothetical protein VIGAN_01353500 [Vigna angularis var. angularis]